MSVEGGQLANRRSPLDLISLPLHIKSSIFFTVHVPPPLTMAAAMKHSTRLLSPSESLLYALLPSVTRTTNRPAILQRRWASNRAQARALPADFDINRILAQQSQPQQEQELDKLSEYTLDEAIDRRWVQTKDTVTGKLGAPQLLDVLINSIDRSTHSVVQLAAVGPIPDTAVVEVAKRSDLLVRLAQKQRIVKDHQKQLRTNKTKLKQIELNWAISENDLALKLRQMEKFLSKGSRVEVLLANKRRQRKAERDEAQATLDKVRATIQEMEGVAERGMEGQVGAQATLTVEPR